MVKASEVVYKYYEVGFAVKHKKDGFKAGFVGVLIGYYLCRFFCLRNPSEQSYFFADF